MFAITNSADAKGADCWLEAFHFDKQGFLPGLVSGALFLFFSLFYEKNNEKKCDRLTLPTHHLCQCVWCDWGGLPPCSVGVPHQRTGSVVREEEGVLSQFFFQKNPAVHWWGAGCPKGVLLLPEVFVIDLLVSCYLSLLLQVSEDERKSREQMEDRPCREREDEWHHHQHSPCLAPWLSFVSRAKNRDDKDQKYYWVIKNPNYLAWVYFITDFNEDGIKSRIQLD